MDEEKKELTPHQRETARIAQVLHDTAVMEWTRYYESVGVQDAYDFAMRGTPQGNWFAMAEYEAARQVWRQATAGSRRPHGRLVNLETLDVDTQSREHWWSKSRE